MLDIIIRGGRVVDGTGSPWFRADLGVKDGKISRIGSIREKADRTINASGKTVSPGFIDIHTHAEDITAFPRAENFLRQGVTTVVAGNCGMSAFPVGKHLAEVEKARPHINYASLVGHGEIRKRVMGMNNSSPGRKKMSEMCRLVEEAMREGSLGISTGLFYVPGAYAGIEELSELARAASGGYYATHARSAGGKLFEALEEAAATGKRSGVPVEISHLKVLHRKGRTRMDRAAEALLAIERARESGADITFDVYPYPASATSLAAVIIPPWVPAEGSLEKKLGEAKVRDAIRPEVKKKIAWMGGAGNIVITCFDAQKDLEGKTLGAAAGGASAEADYAMDMIARGGPRCIFHSFREEDVQRIMLSENAIIASDAGVDTGRGAPHPRFYGSFPRVIRKYVREKGLLTLERAVMKMTSFPAARAGLPDRGVIKTGMKADLNVFDPASFSDRGGFEDPALCPAGLSHVLVNGKPALSPSGISSPGNGEVIRKV